MICIRGLKMEVKKDMNMTVLGQELELLVIVIDFIVLLQLARPV